MSRSEKKIAGKFGPNQIPTMIVLVEHPTTQELHQLMPTEDEYVELVRAIVGTFEDGLLPMLPHPVGQRQWTGPADIQSRLSKPSEN